jgi:integral membrane sensor domain MASE1
LCAVSCAISIALSYLGVIVIQFKVPGVSAVYPASVFYALCTYWFGGWGLVASYVGAFIGAGILLGVQWDTALLVAVADIWEPLIPFLLLRSFGPRLGISPLGDNIMGSLSRTALFIVFGAVLPPFVSGLWGTGLLVKERGEFWQALYTWWIGASILLAVFVPPLCRLMAGILRKKDLACHGIWS